MHAMNSPKVWLELWAEMRQNWENKSDAWVETTAEMFYDQLGAVYPVAMIPGAFVMGEPWSTDSEGNYVHAIFAQKQGSNGWQCCLGRTSLYR